MVIVVLILYFLLKYYNISAIILLSFSPCRKLTCVIQCYHIRLYLNFSLSTSFKIILIFKFDYFINNFDTLLIRYPILHIILKISKQCYISKENSTSENINICIPHHLTVFKCNVALTK